LPRIKSAKKQLRTSQARRLRNQATRARVKTIVRAARAAVAASAATAESSVRHACKTVDKAASKGVLHRNAAARRKSRLMKRARRAA
jgi:small subunit ribosomal protein S20